jgi:hypothetical protein
MQRTSLGKSQPITSAVAQPLSREQKMRAQLAFSLMEATLQKATCASDPDREIAFLEQARGLFDTASNALASLRTMSINTAELKLTFKAANERETSMLMPDAEFHLAQVEIEINTSLVNAFRSKIETTDNDDEKINFLKLERAENQRGAAIYARLHPIHLPMSRNEQKKFLVDSCIDLANACRSKVISIQDDKESNPIELLILAQESIGEARKTLEELPNVPDLIVHKDNATWNEWEIKRALEIAHFRQIKKLETHAGEALRELDSSKPHPPERRAELLTDFQGKVEKLLEENKNAMLLFCDIQNISKKLQNKKHRRTWNSTTDLNRGECKRSTGRMRTALVEVAAISARYQTELASARLEQVKEESSPNIQNLAAKWQRQHKEIILSLQVMFNLDDEEKVYALPDLKEYKALASLVNQLQETEGEAQWLVDLSKRKEMPQHAEQFASLAACCKELGNALENELKNSKAGLSKEKKSALHQEEKQEGDVWVRGGEDDAVNAAVAGSEDEEKSAVEEQQDQGQQTSTKGLETAKGKLAKLQVEIERSTELSEFILKEQGSFFQFDGFFKQIVEKQKSAVNVLSGIVARLAKRQPLSKHLMNEMNDLKADLHNRETWLANIQSERIHAAKTLPPSGQALKFLLEAGQIEKVELTVDRKKLKGTIFTDQGPTDEDYMDEHQIFIKGLAQPLILHTHYKTVDATLEEKTASHLKFQGADKEDVRNRVSLELLEELYSRVPVKNA